jgi:hypothetical protein
MNALEYGSGEVGSLQTYTDLVKTRERRHRMKALSVLLRIAMFNNK